MLIRARYARVLGGAAVLLAGVSGCRSDEACAGVGVSSQVGVYVVQDGFDDLAGASYELCTRGKCVEGELGREGILKVDVALPNDVGPDRAPVRFRATRAGADAPFIDDSVDVELSYQSDGCGGGGYSQGLALTAEDGLLPSVPKKVSEAWLEQVMERATAAPDPSASS